MRALSALFCLLLLAALPDRNASAQTPASQIEAILSLPDDQLDYGRAKLAFDRIIDPSINADAVSAEIARLARSASALAGAHAPPSARLAALRRTIYESGAWNGRRPFAYDHADPLGRNIRNKLLSTYLATRRGNCVSMPLLMLIAGERMGLNLALSTAPLHVFLRFTDESGREINIEATSGGHPARTLWYRHNMQMSERAIESGLYLRTLTRREGIAHLANMVVDFLLAEGRVHDAIEVGRLILRHHPRDGHAPAKLGTAYGELMRVHAERFSAPAAMPAILRSRYEWLAERNRSAFQTAEALGWEPIF
jgi:regulator of sirC expression with transglutaminase-like and TPR domain